MPKQLTGSLEVVVLVPSVQGRLSGPHILLTIILDTIYMSLSGLFCSSLEFGNTTYENRPCRWAQGYMCTGQWMGNW